MWLLKRWYFAFLLAAILNYARVHGNEDGETSGSGFNSGETEEEDAADNDISTHIKKGAKQVMHSIVNTLVSHTGEKVKNRLKKVLDFSKKNHVAVTAVKREKEPKITEAIGLSNITTSQTLNNFRREYFPAARKGADGQQSKVRSNIPYPAFIAKNEEIPGIVQVLPAELAGDFGPPMELQQIIPSQQGRFYRKDYMSVPPKLAQSRKKVEDSVPYSVEQETHLAPDVKERYEHISDEARHEIRSHSLQAQKQQSARSKLHHKAQVSTSQTRSSLKSQKTPITSNRALDIATKLSSPASETLSTRSNAINKSGIKARQSSTPELHKGMNQESKKPALRTTRRKQLQSPSYSANQYFSKPQKGIKKEIDFGAPLILETDPKTVIDKSSSQSKKPAHDRKFTVSHLGQDKEKQKNKTTFKRFPEASANPASGVFSKIFKETADVLGSLPFLPLNGESQEQSFFPLSFGKLPQDVSVATSETSSSPADITPAAAAATPTEEGPILNLAPSPPKEDDSSTTEITLTTQPNEQLVNEIKGIEARVGVLEAAVNQIRESVDSLKKSAEEKEAPAPPLPEGSEPEISFSHPVVQEMIIEAIKNPQEEQPRESPLSPEGIFGGSPFGGQEDSNLPGGKPHELKEVFIPLPPRHSGAETEIEEGAPVPGLPFPINIMVSKVLKKMLKAREEKERDGPAASLTPSPDSDAPPTEHDIGQLENEIGSPFDQIFSSDNSEPSASFANEEDSLEKPRGPAVMEITVSKAGKEPQGCESDCLNGGFCSGDSCKCPPLFTGQRCETFALLNGLKPLKQVSLNDSPDLSDGESTVEISRPLSSEIFPLGPQKFDPRNLLKMVTGFVRQLAKNKKRHHLFKRSLKPRRKRATKRYIRYPSRQ